MTEDLVKALLRAQDDFQDALKEHRRRQDDGSRLTLEMARRRLDELQRVAMHAVEEVNATAER